MSDPPAPAVADPHRISLVIPVLNERESLTPLVAEIREAGVQVRVAQVQGRSVGVGEIA